MYNTLNTYNKTYDFEEKSKISTSPPTPSKYSCTSGNCVKDPNGVYANLKACESAPTWCGWSGPHIGGVPALPPCWYCDSTKSTCTSSKQVCKKDAAGNIHNCKKGNNWGSGISNDGQCNVDKNGKYSAGCVDNFGCDTSLCPTPGCVGHSNNGAPGTIPSDAMSAHCSNTCKPTTPNCYNTCTRKSGGTIAPCTGCGVAMSPECSCLNQKCTDTDSKNYLCVNNTGNFPNCKTTPIKPYCWDQPTQVENNGSYWYLQYSNSFLGCGKNCTYNGVYAYQNNSWDHTNDISWAFVPYGFHKGKGGSIAQYSRLGLLNKTCDKYLTVQSSSNCAPSGTCGLLDSWSGNTVIKIEAPDEGIFPGGSDLYNGQLYDGCTILLYMEPNNGTVEAGYLQVNCTCSSCSDLGQGPNCCCSDGSTSTITTTSDSQSAARFKILWSLPST